ncbi:MAG: hypothetical protein NZ957_01995 [Thaumarchaeota archaeon]|nr:hypothetical protein [Candidatus Calditenuaceae archaeon]
MKGVAVRNAPVIPSTSSSFVTELGWKSARMLRKSWPSKGLGIGVDQGRTKNLRREEKMIVAITWNPARGCSRRRG